MVKINEGFKQTELGPIPYEWNVLSLQQMIDSKVVIGHLDGNHGSLYPKAHEFVSQGVPYISANCIKNGRVDISLAKHLSLERANKFKKGISKNGDVLFAHNATVGPVAILETDSDYVILSTSLTYYRCNPQKIISNYLSSYMQSPYFVTQYSRVMNQTTRNQVPITIQREFLHIIPPVEEQNLIAEILSTVNDAISKTDEIIEQAKKVKKGLMQELLTKGIGHMEFKKTGLGEIPPDWEVVKLKEIAKIVTGSTPKTSEPGNYGNDYLWVSPVDMGTNKYIKHTTKMLSKEGFSKTRKLPKGSILVTCIGSTIGKIGIADSHLSTNQQINSLVCKDSIYNEFIYYSIDFNFSTYKTFISNQAIPIINKTTFSEFLLALPPLKEQYKIASILSACDSKIESQENRKIQLEQIRKGLMQDLLTGKVRVKV